MAVHEVRLELSELMIQELLWRALNPDGIVIMGTFNQALDKQITAVGAPEDAQVSGVSVSLENNRVIAEIMFTKPGEPLEE